MDSFSLCRCQEIVGHQFSDVRLLRQALTHSSAAATRAESNERMEFLGDAVLGMVICQELFNDNPDLEEGDMTKIKSTVVSRQTCARISISTGITELLKLGKGIAGHDEVPMSLSANVLESVIGAVFLDGGFDPARRFILQHMRPFMDEAIASQHQANYKSLLQQHAQRVWGLTPQYDLLDEKGPEHAKCFEIAARLNGRHFPSAWGISKKEAEQKAALAALQSLGVLPAEPEVG